MNTIVANLLDISWWFNNFFPVAAVVLLPRVARLVKARARSAFRTMKMRRLERVRHLRWDHLRIAFEMQKATAYFLVFVMFGLADMAVSISSPVMKTSWVFPFLTAIPVLLAEMAWLMKDDLVKDALRYRDKISRCDSCR